MNRKKNLVEYFKKNLSKGYKEDSLKWALVNQGYSKIIVDSSFRQAKKELSEEENKKSKKTKEKPKIRYEIYDEKDRLISPKKSFFKKIVDFFTKK